MRFVLTRVTLEVCVAILELVFASAIVAVRVAPSIETVPPENLVFASIITG